MKKIAFSIIGLFVISAACVAAGSSSDETGLDKDALPQVTVTTQPPLTPEQEENVDRLWKEIEALDEPTTCDIVREALLTGTQAEIKTAMQNLVNDKTADADAREYAQEYLSVKPGETILDHDHYGDMVKGYCSF